MTCQSEAGSRRVFGRRGLPSNARWPLKRSALTQSRGVSRGTPGVVRSGYSVEQSVAHPSPGLGHRPKFRIGDRVLARWSDRRFYPACISAVIDFGDSYKVDFDDGFTKILAPGNIRRIDKSHADRSKPGSRFSPRGSSSCRSVSESIDSVDARRRRLVRRNQIGASSSSDGSLDTSFDRESVPGGVRRIGVLSASLSGGSLLTATDSSSVSKKCKSMGSCGEGSQRKCSTPDHSFQEDATAGDEVFERRHSAPASVQTSPTSVEDSRNTVNGFHQSDQRRRDCLGKRTSSSMPLSSVNGHRGPQTVGEATSACSTASSSPSRSDADHQPVCNGNGSDYTFGESQQLDPSGGVCHSGELQPVLFPKIPELPPLSPHHSPLQNQSLCSPDLHSTAPDTTAGDPVLDEVDDPQPAPLKPFVSLAMSPQLSPNTARILPAGQSKSSSVLSHHHPVSNGGEGHGQNRRRRRKLADAVLQPPPKVVAPKEVVPLADHNLFKCNVAGCDKSFRKLNRLEYHIKYYHPECKRELEAVIRQQEHGRKGTSSRRESARTLETGRSSKLSTAAQNLDQRRPLGRRKYVAGNGAHVTGRVARRSVNAALTRTSTQGEKSTSSGFMKWKGSVDAGSGAGDTSDGELRMRATLKRRRQSLEGQDDARAKRPRTLSTTAEQKHTSATYKNSGTNGQDCKVMVSRRSLSFSDDGMQQSPDSTGHLSGVRRLPKKGEASCMDNLATCSQVPGSAIICCPCREDHRSEPLVRCPSCHCYQHSSCVLFTSLATYCCPACARPAGLRKRARLKYASVWHDKGTLPWASLAARLQPPLSAQVTALSHEVDELSWKMLVHSLTLAHDIGNEVVAVREVLQLTRVLMHQLQTNSLENVQRDFLPACVKTDSVVTQGAEAHTSDVSTCDAESSCGKSVATTLLSTAVRVAVNTVAESPVTDPDRTSGTEAPVLSPICQSNTKVADSPVLAEAETPSKPSSLALQPLRTSQDASPSQLSLLPAKSVPNSPRLLALLQKGSGQAANEFSFPDLPSNGSLNQSSTSPTAMQHPSSPLELAPANLPDMATQPAVTSPKCSPLSPFACKLASPSSLLQVPVSLSSEGALATLPHLVERKDIGQVPAVKSPVSSAVPSPFTERSPTNLDHSDSRHDGGVPAQSSTSPKGDSSQGHVLGSSPKGHESNSTAASEQNSTIFNSSSAHDSSADRQHDVQSDPQPHEKSSAADTSAQDNIMKEQYSSSPQQPTAEELERVEHERKVIHANILAFVEEKHAMAKVQLDRLEKLVTSLEDAGSFDAAVDGNSLRPFSNSSLMNTTLSQLRLLRKALCL